jgi:tRNA(Ile2) C34 agmatinyltransferase TiaS
LLLDSAKRRKTAPVDDDRPPICPVCGVTMVAAELSAQPGVDGDWVCLECEETGDAS